MKGKKEVWIGLGILIILAGAFVGNYVQQNKDDVKAKLKKFIDRM